MQQNVKTTTEGSGTNQIEKASIAILSKYPHTTISRPMTHTRRWMVVYMIFFVILTEESKYNNLE